MPLVLGFFQDPLIELQPAEFAIQEVVRFIENLRQLGDWMLTLCRMIDHGGSLPMTCSLHKSQIIHRTCGPCPFSRGLRHRS